MAIRQQDQAVVAAKLQTGLLGATDAFPTLDYTTDVIQVLGPPEIRFNIDRVAREIVKSTLGASGERVTSMYVEVTFRVEMKGGGVDGSGNVIEPRIGRLIQACGFKMISHTDTNTGLVDYFEYTPSSAEFGSADRPAIALELYMGMSGTTADRFQIVNAGGTFRFTGSVGQYPVMEFTFTGQLKDGPTTVTVPSVTYENTEPSPFLSANIIFDGNNTFVFNSLGIDSNNDIIIRRDVRTDTGILGILLGKRRITASLDPEATFANVYDWLGKLKQGATVEITVDPVGEDTGNKFSFYAPRAQFTEVTYTNRDSILTHDVSLLLTEVNGDDELVIKFQ